MNDADGYRGGGSHRDARGDDPLGMDLPAAGGVEAPATRAGLGAHPVHQLNRLADEAVDWMARASDRRGRHGRTDGLHPDSPRSVLARALVVLLAHLDAEDEIRVSTSTRNVAETVGFLAAGEAGAGFYASALEPTGAALLMSASARRYVDVHVAPQTNRRLAAVLSVADLDDDLLWKTVADLTLADLGEVLWVVEMADAAPGRAAAWHNRFELAGWHHVDVNGDDSEALFGAFSSATDRTDRPSVVFVHPGASTDLLTPWGPTIPAQGAGLGPDPHGLPWSSPAVPQPRVEVGKRPAVSRERRHRASALRVPTDTGLQPRGMWSALDAFEQVAESLAGDPAVGTRLVSTGQIMASQTTSSTEILALTELGLLHATCGEPMIPIGLVDDPITHEDLELLTGAAASGSRFLLVADAAGSAGPTSADSPDPLGLSAVARIEPAFGRALDWMVCVALGDIGSPEVARREGLPTSYLLRLSHAPLDQELFARAQARIGADALRRQVLGGAYRLIEAGQPQIQLAGAGAVVGSLLEAAEVLNTLGIQANVVEVTSEDLLYLERQRALVVARRMGISAEMPEAMAASFDPTLPLVVAHHVSSSPMSWLGPALRTRTDNVALPHVGVANASAATAIANAARMLLAH